MVGVDTDIDFAVRLEVDTLVDFVVRMVDCSNVVVRSVRLCCPFGGALENISPFLPTSIVARNLSMPC